MNGPFYQITIKNGNDTDLGDRTILLSDRANSSPKLSFATIIEQDSVKHVQVGNYVTSDGTARDISASFLPDPGNVDYRYDHPERDTFCVEQKIAFTTDVAMTYGTTYFIEYEKLNVLGFIIDSESPDYELKDTLEISFGSGSSAGTIHFQVDDNKIRVDSDNFPKVPTQSDPVTIKFICKFNFSSDDYEKVIIQDMCNIYNGHPYEAYGYSFYDEVLVQDGFTVTFNSQGGSSVSPITGVESGSTIEPPEPPTKEHCNFQGWFKEPECLNEWDFYKDVVVEDTILYAKFTLDTFVVHFNSEGGTQVSPYTSVEYGSTIPEPSTPEKLEKDFGGWFKDEEYENEWDFENDVVTSNTTLFAKWIDWSTSRISNPNAFSGMPLTLLRGRKVRREFKPFR